MRTRFLGRDYYPDVAEYLKGQPDARRVAADAIARACNADTAAKFHGVTRGNLTLGDLEALHANYIAAWFSQANRVYAGAAAGAVPDVRSWLELRR